MGVVVDAVRATARGDPTGFWGDIGVVAGHLEAAAPPSAPSFRYADLPALGGGSYPVHMEIILASTSPYRRALLARLGLPFTTLAPDFSEQTPEQLAEPEAMVIANALLS